MTEAQRDAIADELNDRPRKRLAFANPTEQLAELLLVELTQARWVGERVDCDGEVGPALPRVSGVAKHGWGRMGMAPLPGAGDSPTEGVVELIMSGFAPRQSSKRRQQAR